jgi:hypothetical protein
MRSGTKNRKVVRAGPRPHPGDNTVCGFYGYVTFGGFTCQMGRAPAGTSIFQFLGHPSPSLIGSKINVTLSIPRMEVLRSTNLPGYGA